MSYLLELTRKLQETETAIVRAEHELSGNRRSAILRWSLESVIRIRDELENDFNRLVLHRNLDVVRYRVFSETEERLSVRGLTQSLLEFQNVFSAVYDATKNGPKQTLKFGPDVNMGSRLEIGYAYAGSIGFVLTIPRQTELFDSDLIANSVRKFFQLAQAKTAEDIREMGMGMGAAPIRALSNWAKAHVNNKIGAYISWRQGDAVKNVLLPYIQMRRITREMKVVPPGDSEQLLLNGVFEGISLRSRNFQFLADSGEQISGNIKGTVDAAKGVQVGNAQYEVRLERTESKQSISDERKVSWELIEYRALAR